MYRHSQISPEHAQAIVDDFYGFVDRVRTRFCAVHFAGAAKDEQPLVIMPPKGVRANAYRHALLLQAGSQDHTQLRMADEKFRAHIGEALSENADMNEKTIARSLVNVVTSCNLKL